MIALIMMAGLVLGLLSGKYEHDHHKSIKQNKIDLRKDTDYDKSKKETIR